MGSSSHGGPLEIAGSQWGINDLLKGSTCRSCPFPRWLQWEIEEYLQKKFPT